MKTHPIKTSNLFLWILSGVMAVTLSGCALSPQKIQHQICSDCQFKTLLSDTLFPLTIAWRNSIPTQQTAILHIYLEGDGRPYYNDGRTPTKNPSSANLTALKLMMLDTQPSVYLNRPCYGQDVLPTNCHPLFWTQGRYSQTIVNQLTLAVQLLKQDSPKAKVLLIGHSGGGTLAMLVAQHTQVEGVVTLGANLDHAAWTDYFNYLPLNQSLNLMNYSLLPPTTLRWHLAAKDDFQVPFIQIQNAAQKDPLAQFTLLPEGDHHCCWARSWPSFLSTLNHVYDL